MESFGKNNSATTKTLGVRVVLSGDKDEIDVCPEQRDVKPNNAEVDVTQTLEGPSLTSLVKISASQTKDITGTTPDDGIRRVKSEPGTASSRPGTVLPSNGGAIRTTNNGSQLSAGNVYPRTLYVSEVLGATPVLKKSHNVLEQMKRRLTETHYKPAMPRIEIEDKQEPKATYVPGTDCEYRTPGANYKNKNGRVKRPMNAFMVWAREYRGRLSTAMPNATNSEISVTLGQVWASLSSMEKRKYYEAAELIKQKHRRDFPDWVYQPAPQKKEDPVISRPTSGLTPVVLQAQQTQRSHVLSPVTLQQTRASTFSPLTTADDTARKLQDSQPVDRMNSACWTPVPSGKPQPSVTTAQPVGQTLIESADRKPVPVILQRVSYQPMSRDLPDRNHVTPLTKGMLANKIVNGRASLNASPKQQTNIVLTPFCQLPNGSILMSQSTSRPAMRNDSAVSCANTASTNLIRSKMLPTPQVGVQSVNGYEASKPVATTLAVPTLPEAAFFSPTVSNSYRAKQQRRPVCRTGNFILPKPNPSADMSLSSPSSVPRNTGSIVTHNASNSLKLNVQTPPQPEVDTDKLLDELQASISEIFKQASLNSQNVTPPSTNSIEDGGNCNKIDDVWPFPFSQNPAEWNFDGYDLDDLYMELLDPYDAFLLSSSTMNDVFPGSLHLDVDRWQRFLNDTNDTEVSDPLTTLAADADDIHISPLPLKETLRRNLRAHVQASGSGDVITGDLVVSELQQTIENVSQQDVVEPLLSAEEAVDISSKITLSLGIK